MSERQNNVNIGVWICLKNHGSIQITSEVMTTMAQQLDADYSTRLDSPQRYLSRSTHRSTILRLRAGRVEGQIPINQRSVLELDGPVSTLQRGLINGVRCKIANVEPVERLQRHIPDCEEEHAVHPAARRALNWQSET